MPLLLVLATVLVSAVLASQSATAQTLTTLYSFCTQADCTDGGQPFGPLIQATDGNLYGTTGDAGVGVTGVLSTMFSITPGGTLTTLYNFTNGYASGGLLQATDGNFYGTTASSGTAGAVFKSNASGTLTTVRDFDGDPQGLLQAMDGNFYGTIGKVIFKMTPAGAFTKLNSICSNCGFPSAGLVQAPNGDFYGTTSRGSTVSGTAAGTIFSITPTGTLTTLYIFSGPDGSSPNAPLVRADDGNFYGTTPFGGANGEGTVFKITAAGELTTLYSFCAEAPACADGFEPSAGLIRATDGDFYGTTAYGGTDGGGTIYKISPAGTLRTLYNFCAPPGCNYPYASALVQATDGNFYGTTLRGGTYNAGTVFSLSVGLGPFVRTQTPSGAVGGAVIILGNSLTGSTGVTFNGIAASFTVVSDTEIAATVPAGAKTGYVEVTTLGGTVLKSNMKFTIYKPTL